MENANKHKMSLGRMMILLLLSFIVIEAFVFAGAYFFAEEVECHWWGCKFTTTTTHFLIDSNMTYEEILIFLNETSNGTKCFVNNTWVNVSCKEAYKSEFIKELEEVINKTKNDNKQIYRYNT